MLATILPILTQAERESGRCRHRRSRLVPCERDRRYCQHARSDARPE